MQLVVLTIQFSQLSVINQDNTPMYSHLTNIRESFL